MKAKRRFFGVFGIAIGLGLLAGCGNKDEPINKAEKEDKDKRGVLKYDISQGVPLTR